MSIASDVSYQNDSGLEAPASDPLTSLDSELFGDDILDEDTPLFGSSQPRKGKLRRCCSATAKVLTPSRIKTAVFVLIFIGVCVLFTQQSDSLPNNNSLISVSNVDDFDLVLSQPRSYVNLEVVGQRLPASRYPSNVTRIWIEVLSGAVCNASSSCTVNLTLNTAGETHETVMFGLDDQVTSTLRVTTDSAFPVAVSLTVDELGYLVGYQVLIAAVILLGVYVLIIFELVDRTIAAMFGAFVALAVLSNLHNRPSFEEVLMFVDWDTLGLLFGMMVMVGIFSTTGIFEYSAVRMYKMSKGNLWHLVTLLCFFTAIVSAFLDNVTTILLLTPVTIRLCKVLDVDPVKILMALVVFSNVGGTATAIGDPPNIIIVSDSRITASGEVSFGTMTLHLMPGVVLALGVTYLIVRYWFHSNVKRLPHNAAQQELDIWRQTARRLQRGGTDEELAVLEQLQSHIAALEEAAERESATAQVEEVDISELEERYVIRDKPLLINASIILTGVIVLFFLHSFVEINLNLAWIALIGAIMLLLVAQVHDIEEVLEHVEWGTLIFFAGLFILMESLDEMGLIAWIGAQVSNLILLVPEGGQARLAAAVTLIIWISGVASAFIDNIPFTTAMVPVVMALTKAPLELPLTPLVWALSFGACFGGNGTLIGASANVVCAGLAEQAGHHISFKYFFKKGMFVMVCTLAVANVYMLVFHVAIQWY